MHSVYEVQADG